MKELLKKYENKPPETPGVVTKPINKSKATMVYVPGVGLVKR